MRVLLTVEELRVKYTLLLKFPLKSAPQPILSLTAHLWLGTVVQLLSPQQKLNTNWMHLQESTVTVQLDKQLNYNFKTARLFLTKKNRNVQNLCTKRHMPLVNILLQKRNNKLTVHLLPDSRWEQYSVSGCVDNHVEPKQWKHHFHHAKQRFLVNHHIMSGIIMSH